MKKNVMMRLASFLLVAVLISTSAISGTYAKYVTSGTATDSARVAKWGVTFDIEGGPLFDTQYETDDKDTTYASMTYSVKSSGTDNVVAPGTAGTLVKFRTQGTPEVSYKVEMTTNSEGVDEAETIFTKYDITYNAEEKKYEKTEITSGLYYPVVFTLKYNNQEIGSNYTTIATLNEDIGKCGYYFDVTTGKYHVTTNGTNYGSVGQDTAPELEINWVWAFDGVDGANDVHDTTLGDLAAIKDLATNVTMTDGTDYNLDLKVNITATATQID